MVEVQTTRRNANQQLAKPYIFVIQLTATYYGFIADTIRFAALDEHNITNRLPIGRFTVAGSVSGALCIAGLWKLNANYQRRRQERLHQTDSSGVAAERERYDGSYRRAALVFFILNRTINLIFGNFTNIDKLDSEDLTNTTIIVGVTVSLLAASLAVMASSYAVKKQNLSRESEEQRNVFTL